MLSRNLIIFTETSFYSKNSFTIVGTTKFHFAGKTSIKKFERVSFDVKDEMDLLSIILSIKSYEDKRKLYNSFIVFTKNRDIVDSIQYQKNNLENKRMKREDGLWTYVYNLAELHNVSIALDEEEL